jgi:phosphoenolpyruvate carboxykinase (GTP)
VNWFRKDAEGNFLWPGFGENSRVLAWIFRRCEGSADAVETPVGYVPTPDGIDTTGLDVSEDDLAELLRVDVHGLRTELPTIHAHFAQFGNRLPKELRAQLEELEKRLEA